MKKLVMLSILALLLALGFATCTHAEVVAGEGYALEDGALCIRLWERGEGDIHWVWDLENEAVLLPQDEPPFLSGEGIRAWQFAPGESGEALLTFSYAEENTSQSRTLCYTVSVQDGLIDDVMMEDLSDDSEFSGDEGGVVRYRGETGGVELQIQENMSETQTDNGVLLTSDDGSATILIDYQPQDDPAELFEQLKDQQSAAELYDDEGVTIIDSYVDEESDPPCATFVMKIPEGMLLYTGYQAPDGGVLHVHTTYLIGEEMDGFE